MPFARDYIITAYQAFLGREPENEQVIAEKMAVGSLEELREQFLGSEEFQAKRGDREAGVGTFLDVTDDLTEVVASPEQLARMLDNIRREWRKFGETDPHWSVLTNPAYKADQIDGSMNDFYASGLDNLPLLRNPLLRSGLAADRLGKVMDFGCGVGRLSLALAGISDEVVGVDISPGHLRCAEDRARAVGIANARFEAIDEIDDLDRFSGFNLIVSMIVLQHNPPPIIAVLLAKLLAALAPGGAAVVQIPTYIHGQHFNIDDYLATTQPTMEMNALPQHHVFRIIEEADCSVLEVRQDRWIGSTNFGLSHTFAVRRRPARSPINAREASLA